MSASTKVNPEPFYGEWSGHSVADLTKVLAAIKTARPSKPIVYLAGDSSLDNKAWVPSSRGSNGKPLPMEVPAIYNTFLRPAVPKPDVAFWINAYLGDRATCLNTAIEATTLKNRDDGLLPQDKFIRDNITQNDILIVSIGANDIALAPTPATILNMAKLAWLTPKRSVQNGTAWGLGHFKYMFGEKTQKYIVRLIQKQKPRAVIVCMIYFPFEGIQNGWADRQLSLLGYNRNPEQLQAAITTMFKQATMEIRVDGVQVIPCALYEKMAGKNAELYTERVEPSVQGGEQMAMLFEESINVVLASDRANGGPMLVNDQNTGKAKKKG